MHELSIASSLADIASEHARTAGVARVESITLKLGGLTCVRRESLELSFEMVTQGTILDGARLNFIDVPITLFCKTCNQPVQIAGMQSLRCPHCDTPSGEILAGRELEIVSMEVIDPPSGESRAS